MCYVNTFTSLKTNLDYIFKQKLKHLIYGNYFLLMKNRIATSGLA